VASGTEMRPQRIRLCRLETWMLHDRCSMWTRTSFHSTSLVILCTVFSGHFHLRAIRCIAVCIESGEFRRLVIISKFSLLLLFSLLIILLDKCGLNFSFFFDSHLKCLQLDKPIVSTGFIISCWNCQSTTSPSHISFHLFPTVSALYLLQYNVDFE
jgi:hypothetical protein